MRGIAEGFGARTEKIDRLAVIGDVLNRALAHLGPSFLVIDREP
jgi:benzoylformate decarboxylase